MFRWKMFYMNKEKTVYAHDWSFECRSEIDCLWIVVNFVFVLLIKIGFMTWLCFCVARWRSNQGVRQWCHELVGVKQIFNQFYLAFQLLQVVYFGKTVIFFHIITMLIIIFTFTSVKMPLCLRLAEVPDQVPNELLEWKLGNWYVMWQR